MNKASLLVLFSLVFLFGFSFATDTGGGKDAGYCESDTDCPECYACGNYGDCYLPEGSCAADCAGYGSELYQADYAAFMDTMEDAAANRQQYTDGTPYDDCVSTTEGLEAEYKAKLKQLSEDCEGTKKAQEEHYAEKLSVLLENCQEETYNESYSQEIPGAAGNNCTDEQGALRSWHEAELTALEEDCYNAAYFLEMEYQVALQELNCYGWINNQYGNYAYNNNGYGSSYSGEMEVPDGRAYYDSLPPEQETYSADDAALLPFACIDCECVLVECIVDDDCAEDCACEGYECICELEPPYRECWVDYDCPSNEYCDEGICSEIPEEEPAEEPAEPAEGEITIIEEETGEGEPPLPEPSEIATDVLPLVEEGGEASETWAPVTEWGWLLFLLIIIAVAIYNLIKNKAKKEGKKKRK